jgi:hypothetical protein
MTGEQYDAPNQQVVRADGSGPADQGEGGSAQPTESERLDAMTKAELLEEADARGVEADSTMTKAEIRSALDAPETAGEGR